jgi:hypothetical protein
MRNRLRGLSFASAIGALITTLQLGVTPTASQADAYKAPRTADGKPNLNGVWQALNTANWNIQEHAARAGQVVALGARAGLAGRQRGPSRTESACKEF